VFFNLEKVRFEVFIALFNAIFGKVDFLVSGQELNIGPHRRGVFFLFEYGNEVTLSVLGK